MRWNNIVVFLVCGKHEIFGLDSPQLFHHERNSERATAKDQDEECIKTLDGLEPPLSLSPPSVVDLSPSHPDL